MILGLHATARKPSNVGACAANSGLLAQAGGASAADCGGTESSRSYDLSLAGSRPRSQRGGIGRAAASGSTIQAFPRSTQASGGAVAERGDGAWLLDRFVDGSARAAADSGTVRCGIPCELHPHAAQGSPIHTAQAGAPGSRAERGRDRALGAVRLAAHQKKRTGRAR